VGSFQVVGIERWEGLRSLECGGGLTLDVGEDHPEFVRTHAVLESVAPSTQDGDVGPNIAHVWDDLVEGGGVRLPLVVR
jgi:hypothetical protein